MKILALAPQMSGVEYHRIYIPLKRMDIDNPDIEVFILQGKKQPEWQEFDMVVFNRYLYENHYPIIHQLAERGIPYILDLDDYWKLPKFHHASKYFKKNSVTAAIKDAIQYAAGVTVTTEELAAQVRPLNHNVCILPNCIEWSDDQWSHTKTRSNKIRFGWVGGVTHENDLNIISDQVNWILDNYDVEFHVCGYVEGDMIWERIRKKFPKAYFHKGMAANEYAIMYTIFDVALVPLEESKYNSLKSELKIVEAGEYAIPVICSVVKPYTNVHGNEGVMFVRNDEWINAMQTFIHSPSLIDVYGSHNHKFVREHYNLEEVNNKRLEFYKRICKKSNTIARG